MVIDPKKKYTATLSTDKGDIMLELFADKTPSSVFGQVIAGMEVLMSIPPRNPAKPEYAGVRINAATITEQ